MASITDKIGSHSFANANTYKFDYTTVTDPTTGAQGNGLNFFQTSVASNYAVSTLTFVPSGGVLGDTDTGNVGEEWTLWFVIYQEPGLTHNTGVSRR